MSLATSLFAIINGANGIPAGIFSSHGASAPPDNGTGITLTQAVNGAGSHSKGRKHVTMYAIFNESATETIHQTTDIHDHNLAKQRLRCNGQMLHTSHSSAFLKLQARKLNEAVRQRIQAAKEKE